MNATDHIEKIQSATGVVVGVDIAKTVFQLCVADTKWHRLEKQRLSRSQFEQWFDNPDVALVVMEACGMAHHWSGWLAQRGVQVIMLPAHYVRAYRKRNKTDASDAAALLEAARCADIEPVRLKTVEQQALQALHRARSLWMGWRTGQINALRGACREFGLDVSLGAKKGLEQQAADTRRAQCAQGRSCGPGAGQAAGCAQALGAAIAGPGGAQQGSLCAGQQVGAHLLRVPERPGALRAKKDLKSKAGKISTQYHLR